MPIVWIVGMVRDSIWTERERRMAKKSKLEIEREKLAKLDEGRAAQVARIKALESEERTALLGRSVLAKASFDELSELVAAVEKIGMSEALRKLR